MSAEEAVTDALQTPVDQNAQAAEDAKKMLAELQGETASADAPKETNDSTESAKAAEETAPAESVKEAEDTEEKKPDSDKPRENHHPQGRSEGRGRGRGRNDRNGHTPRNYRDNIKSDLTTQEESSDPVAIRKQVQGTSP
jgi:lupus La protein